MSQDPGRPGLGSLSRGTAGGSGPERRRASSLAFLRRLPEHLPPGEAAFYVNEVDIHLNPKIGPDWMPPGTRRIVVTPGNNEQRQLAGAYDPTHGRLVYVAADRKASWLFLDLLRAVLDACRELRVIHLILDNVIIHKSRVTRAWLREHGDRLRLHFLPLYCPDENRIERLWLDLHANVTRDHQCPTTPEPMAAVHRYLREVHGTTGPCKGKYTVRTGVGPAIRSWREAHREHEPRRPDAMGWRIQKL